MAENTENKMLSVVVTNANKLPDLAIKDAQLVFVRDKQKIALDIGGIRTFYNEIVTLETESERTSLSPVEGLYYFIIETAVLWTYQATGWIKLTTSPEEIIFIGTSLPGLGTENKIYINKIEKNIFIWDNETQNFIPISNYTETIEGNEILSLFN